MVTYCLNVMIFNDSVFSFFAFSVLLPTWPLSILCVTLNESTICSDIGKCSGEDEGKLIEMEIIIGIFVVLLLSDTVEHLLI